MLRGLRFGGASRVINYHEFPISEPWQILDNLSLGTAQLYIALDMTPNMDCYKVVHPNSTSFHCVFLNLHEGLPEDQLHEYAVSSCRMPPRSPYNFEVVF